MNIFQFFILVYFLVLNSTYLVLLVRAAREFYRYMRRIDVAGDDDVFANPMAPSVSIVVPAYNEEVGIVENVHSMLCLSYPSFEIVIVDDGSTDTTFEKLRDAFDLVEMSSYVEPRIVLNGFIESVHTARDGSPVRVVRKVNGGSRADAINAGINVAEMDLCCTVDADSLLETKALLHVVKPFINDPEHVVATGGVVRPANGCEVRRGEIVSVGMPKTWWARVQVVEYLRSFLLGRSGWSSFNALFIISGAFGLFRRDKLLELGGFDRDCMGEDAELVARMHHTLRKSGDRKYRMVFVPEPVCWTEVPGDRQVLSRQRRRWSRGLAEVLWKHRAMFFNPRYGRIGMVVVPYYFFFELIGPFVELAGLALMAMLVTAQLTHGVFGLDALDGSLNVPFAIAYVGVAFGYGYILSISALVVEEFSFHRMNRWRDLFVCIVAVLIEQAGLRQLHAVWRAHGLLQWMTRRKSRWGAMPRTGYAISAGTTQLNPLPVPNTTNTKSDEMIDGPTKGADWVAGQAKSSVPAAQGAAMSDD